jgi:2'-hydroxyisoflavone reductase
MTAMRILIIGGTRFVGRHITEAALAAGHQVTLLHRGHTGAELFPDATHLLADRDGDLSALAEGSWDATVDVSAYRPGQLRALAAALPAERAGRYLFVSSTAVYDVPAAPGFTEDSPLRTLADPSDETVDATTYGPLKAVCESTARELYGPGTLVVRPTYVIGPHDHTDRFTFWVKRIARGGEVLAPGRPEDPIQLIDARDMARWMIAMLEGGHAGTFHAVSPPPPFGFGDMLEAIAAEVAPEGTTLTWVGEEFLEAEGVDDTALPLWGRGRSGTAANTADPAAAHRAGLTPRPLRQSVREIYEAADAAPDLPGRLSAEREAGLLAAWARHRG